MSGALFMAGGRGKRCGPAAHRRHNAIFQALPAGFRQGVDGTAVTRILLTASGGPFRCKPVEELAAVTPDMACPSRIG